MCCGKVHSHWLLRACRLGSKRKLPAPACQVLQGRLSKGQAVALSTSVIRVLCQVLEPIAFLVHPVLAIVAEDAVAARSSVTDGAWKLVWTLPEV